MDRKFKENTCLKTPANSNLISQVYQNSMALFITYSNLRKSFEADIMSNIETSLAAALNSLATEKVSREPGCIIRRVSHKKLTLFKEKLNTCVRGTAIAIRRGFIFRGCILDCSKITFFWCIILRNVFTHGTR